MKQYLLCDLHIHSTWSDGKLNLSELVDFYGQRDFDAIAITDHTIDKITYGVNANNWDDYLKAIRSIIKPAKDKYDLLVIPGIEFSNNEDKWHLVALDVDKYIPFRSLTVDETIDEVRKQEGFLFVPHPFKSDTGRGQGKDTVYFWNNRGKYASIVDAWEIANRNLFFKHVGELGVPVLGNSDLHKPKNLDGYKNFIHADKKDGAKGIFESIKNKDMKIIRYIEGVC